MKKILCLLVCMILLIGCVPAATAASLTPESVFGTWTMYKISDSTGYIDAAGLKQAGLSSTINFHADGTGKYYAKGPTGSTNVNTTWKISGSSVVISAKGYYDEYFYQSGSDLLMYSSSLTFHYKKTSDTSGKTTSKAITSTGTYKLNNSKKTAAFTAPANKKAKTLVIPDTIKANGKTYKVTEISAKACASMSKLTTLTIGKNVKTIGANAFSKCKKLNKITINTTSLSKVGAGAFSNVKSSGTVTCPKKKASKYQKLLQKGGLPKKFKVKGK